MLYLKKALLIFFICFIGEILQRIIPIPVPASIYGFVILFILLLLKVVKVEYIKPVTDFLSELMPLTFIAPVAAIITLYSDLKSMLIPTILLTTVGTLIVLGSVAKIVEAILNRKKSSDEGSIK